MKESRLPAQRQLRNGDGWIAVGCIVIDPRMPVSPMYGLGFWVDGSPKSVPIAPGHLEERDVDLEPRTLILDYTDDA